MCLAIPMEVVDIPEPGRARVRRQGLEMDADLSLLEGVQIGDYLLIHAGFAIEKLDLKEAEERLELFRQLSLAEDGLAEDGPGAAEGGSPVEPLG